MVDQNAQVDDALTLVIPAKADLERDQVAAAWIESTGEVLRIDRFWEPPDIEPAAVRPYGNDTFCLVLAQVLDLALISPPDNLLISLADEWLGRAVDAVPLGELASIPFPRFVKPMVPKQFRASIYTDVAELSAETSGLEPETLLIVSDVIELLAEVRAFVLDGEIRTASCYEGDANIRAAVAFAESLAASAALPRTAVLDVGLSAIGWCLIQANATWGSGLNGCDPAAVAECLKAATTLP